MPDDDRPLFTPPDVPQPNFAGDDQDDGVELANEILEEGSKGTASLLRDE